MINGVSAKKSSTVIYDKVIMIESGHSLPDLRDVEEYHDDRKIEKIYRRFRFLNNPVSFELKSDLIKSRQACTFTK